MLFIRCRESIDRSFFVLIANELKKETSNGIECEHLDLCSANYSNNGVSLLEGFLNDEKVRYALAIVLEKKPDVVVTGNDVAISANIIKACNLFGIPSVTIQHGILPPRTSGGVFVFFRWRNYLLWRVISSIANIRMISRTTMSLGWRTRNIEWGLGGATQYALMGNYYKKLLMLQGVSPHKLHVTGYPIFDLVPQYLSDFNREKTCKMLGLNSTEPVILFTTEALVEGGICGVRWAKLLAKNVIDSVNELGMQLVIKVHPRETAVDYRELSKSNKTVTVLKDFDLHTLMCLSDVVITALSTTGLWALVYGKPLISITWLPYNFENIYAKAAYQVGDAKKLSPAIKLVLEDPETRSLLKVKRDGFLTDYYGELDGQASRRIAKLILGVLQKY